VGQGEQKETKLFVSDCYFVYFTFGFKTSKSLCLDTLLC